MSTIQWDANIRAKKGVLPKSAYLWCKGSENLWWLGRIHPVDPLEADTYIVRFIDGPGPVQLTLRPSLYTVSPSAPRGSWRLQRFESKGLCRDMRRKVDRTHDVDAPP